MLCVDSANWQPHITKHVSLFSLLLQAGSVLLLTLLFLLETTYIPKFFVLFTYCFGLGYCNTFFSVC